jgi:hypothetical protein
MAEEHLIVAIFTVPLEAQVACGRLRAEGIAASVSNDVASSAFPGLMGIAGRVELYVPAADRDRAEAILEACMHEQRLSAGNEPPSLPEDNFWVCSLCGDVVPEDLKACPACGTSRAAVRPGPSEEVQEHRPAQRAAPEGLQKDGPTVPEPDLSAGLDLADLATYQGDDLAARAMRTATFTLLLWTFSELAIWLMIPPVVALLLMLPLSLYSFWLLIRLMAYGGEFSATGVRRLYTAVALNVMLGLALLFLVGSALYVFVR